MSAEAAGAGRIPLADFDRMPGELGDKLRRMPVRLNIFRMMANAPTTVLPMLRLGGAILSDQELPHAPRELLILLVARIEGGEYEWIQHDPIAEKVGVTRAQIEAIERLDLAADVFTPAERALLAFARQVIENVRVDDATFAAAHAHYGDRQIVEAILAIGFYMAAARLTEATQTPLDAPLGVSVFNAAQGGATRLVE